MEAGVTGLNHAILVLDPHEHVIRVEEILTRLVSVRVVTEAKRVIAFGIGLAVDRLKNVLGVILEHLLSRFGKLIRVVLVLRVQGSVRRSTFPR